MEVTTATVAAILTVLGYSIYDTIIILDRIRENIPLMRRSSFQEIANVSLWETIRRSLATTFITLLPIAALYLFGGETLKDFAFALLIGIGVRRLLVHLHRGAAPASLKEREPEYAKKKGVFTGELASTTMPMADGERRRPCPCRACGGDRAEAGRGRPTTTGTGNGSDRREQRRQRRRSRPHGRAR